MIKGILIISTVIMYWKVNKEAKTHSDRLVNLGWFWIINVIISRFF